MSDKTYNGWTNYATWRVNLEVFDCQENNWDWFNMDQDVYGLAQDLRAYVEESIENSSTEGLARDYALAFLSDVNWHEIALHMVAELAEDEAE